MNLVLIKKYICLGRLEHTSVTSSSFVGISGPCFHVPACGVSLPKSWRTPRRSIHLFLSTNHTQTLLITLFFLTFSSHKERNRGAPSIDRSTAIFFTFFVNPYLATSIDCRDNTRSQLLPHANPFLSFFLLLISSTLISLSTSTTPVNIYIYIYIWCRDRTPSSSRYSAICW